MPSKNLFVVWLCISLLHNNDALVEEVRRISCPPMARVNQPVNRIDTSDRIMKLRAEMQRAGAGPGYDAFIVNRYDEHLNDLVADHDKRLEFISGYTGVYGVAVITKNKLAFWTDELHYQQADNELSCNWTLFKTDASSSIVAPAEWLVHELSSGTRIGADAKLVPNTEWEIITRVITIPSKTILFYPVVNNYIDSIWPENERPQLSNYPAYVLPEEFSGRSWKDKLAALRAEMKSVDTDAMVITSLNEIAWLLNIRGFDLPYSPFVRAYCVVTKDQLHLYTHTENLSEDVRKHLYTEACVSAYCTRLHEYDSIWSDLRKMSTLWRRILFATMTHYSPGVNRQVYISVAQEKRRMMPSPIMKMMAQKNEAEKRSMRMAHFRDAVMFCNFSVFLEYEIEKSAEKWDELYLVNLTNQFRSTDSLIRGMSFPTVVASGPHSGKPMYIPTKDSNIEIERDQLLIIDSGSHYWDGTTALSRTFLLDPNATQERDIDVYTRLLMGLINVASLSFPQQMTASQLDVIARTPLWNAGYDFPYSAGHGIGSLSNLYEPPDINYKSTTNETLKEGYFIQVEVGFYVPDSFGMKLSLALEVVYKNDSSGYLSFDAVTLFPFESRMINYTLLSIQQKQWLNAYNERVRKQIGDELIKQGNNNAYNWLVDRIERIALAPEEEGSGALSLTMMNSNLNYLLMITFIIRFIMIFN